MAFQIISGEAASRTIKGAPHLRWSNDPGDFSGPIYPVRHAAKFSLSASDRVFCIGSCFARNVEEHLIYQDMNVLSRRIVSPISESGGRPNSIVNKFTTHSMLNELNWVEETPPITPDLFSEGLDGQWTDLQLSTNSRSVSLERAIERRRYLLKDYFARMRDADVVIVTLGMIETWRDELAGIYLNAAPSPASIRRNPGRYTLRVTDFAENIDALENFRAGVKALSANARFVITVSPVPLKVSYTGTDPGVANMLSKSVLRAAAQALAGKHPDVDYFPSFEMITLAPRAAAFGPDCRHVRDESVRLVIESFLGAYMGRTMPSPQGDFTELAYLAANPDVHAAVRAGEYDSGFHHWCRKGRDERRPLTPPGGPTAHMLLAGAG